MATTVKVKVKVGLSEAWRKAQFVARGELPPDQAEVEFDAVEMTTAQRAVVSEYGGVALKMDLVTAPGRLSLREFDGIPSLEAVLAGMVDYLETKRAARRSELARRLTDGAKALQARIAEREPRPVSSYDEVSEAQAAEADALGLDTAAWRAAFSAWTAGRDAWQAEKTAKEERSAAAEALRRANAEREQEECKAAAVAAKAAWVQEFGSDYLKRACANGYDCQRLYVTERAALEAPGFTVDFKDNATWKARSCPSLAALDLEDALKALGLGEVTIVWLTAPAEEWEEWKEFEACEAVVIRGYLGKYDLVRTL